MIPILDQIIPVLATLAGNVTTVPTSVSFTDNANSLYSGLAAIVGFIGILLSTPGIKVWLSHAFGIRKEQIDASAELIGTLASQALKSKEQVAAVIQLIYDLAPPDQKAALDIKVAPILADIQKSIDKINDTLDKIVPKAHPTLTAKLNRNTDMNVSLLSK
jgi:hypothetical protein